MSLHRSADRGSAQRGAMSGTTIRLDLTQNPYGPCPAAIEAIEECRDTSPEVLADSLRRRLSELYRVPAAWIHIFGSVDSAVRALVSTHPGPIITFPPSVTATLVAQSSGRSDPVSIVRGACGDAIVGAEFAADFPENGLAVLDSPSNPLGSIVSPADAMRLSRVCTCVVVDERFAEFSDFSLLPVTRELDNVVVLRSFAWWVGQPDLSCSWAVVPPGRIKALGLLPPARSPEAIAGAMATLENRASLAATLKLVREERSRLFRFLRRLSFIEPLPSWGPFVTGRVTVASRRDLMDGLAERGIRIHAPEESGLEEYIRIGIGSRTAMDQLRAALLELGPQLVA
jgi:histidinol-phosphate aminotransferase